MGCLRPLKSGLVRNWLHGLAEVGLDCRLEVVHMNWVRVLLLRREFRMLLCLGRLQVLEAAELHLGTSLVVEVVLQLRCAVRLYQRLCFATRLRLFSKEVICHRLLLLLLKL